MNRIYSYDGLLDAIGGKVPASADTQEPVDRIAVAEVHLSTVNRLGEVLEGEKFFDKPGPETARPSADENLRQHYTHYN